MTRLRLHDRRKDRSSLSSIVSFCSLKSCIALIIVMLSYAGIMTIWAVMSTNMETDPTAKESAQQQHQQQQQQAQLPHAATHLFDCDGIGSNCTWFRPIEFLESANSNSKVRDFVKSQAYGSPSRKIPANYCRAYLKQGSNDTSRFKPPKPYFPSDLTYIHVRKVGGISMKKVFRTFEAPYRIGVNYSIDVVYSVLEKTLGPIQFQNRVEMFLDTTLLFAFVRDPIDKFLSGSKQIMKHKRPTEGSCNPLSNNSQENMKCLLQLLKRNGEQQFVDEHLAPQILDLYQIVAMGPQPPSNTKKIALLPLSQITNVMEYMGVPTFHANDRKIGNYTKENLTPDMISDICLVYKIDVLMLALIGIPSPHCIS